MEVNCPKCGADITETYQGSDPSVGIYGGWYCEPCDLGVGEHDVDREPMEGDVEIPLAPPRDGPIGTPLSKISGRPGEPGYEEFKRIARSWGYD